MTRIAPIDAGSTPFYLPAVVELDLTCPDGSASVAFRTYAHAVLDRLLVAEVAVERGNATGDVVVTRTDLSGGEGEDFEWGETVEEEEGVL